MTADNVKESLRTWMESQVVNHPALDDIPIVLNGETADAVFPLIAIIDQGAGLVEQEGVVMRGVDSLTIAAEIHTVPEEEAQDGTTLETHRAIVTAAYQVLGDFQAIQFCNGLNDTTVFDIRTSSPTLEPREGRRVSSIQMTVFACPKP